MSRRWQLLMIPGILAILCFSVSVTNAQVQDSAAQDQKINSRQVEYFYIHGALGLGFDVYTSSDIEDLVPDDFNVHEIGFPFQYGFRAGFRNIFQFEFCKYKTSAHNIGTGGYVNGEIVSESVPMDLKATDLLFKINPIFWKWAKPTTGRPGASLFLVFGNGDVEYRDNVDDGFDGSGMIYGLEVGAVNKYASFSVGMTYQTITYDTITLWDIDVPYEVKASRFLLYTRLGIGFGI